MIPNDTKQTPDPVFVEGVIDRGSQKRVAIAVNVNFDLKDGKREGGHAVPIHHIPLLRRLYPGGTIKVLTNWPRGVPRTRDLTQEELKRELEGLTRSYGHRPPGNTATIMAEVYGPTEVIQLQTLHAKMAEVVNAWARLEATAKQRLASQFPGQSFSVMELHGVTSQVITEAEIESLVKLIEPEREELGEIQLPELSALSGSKDTGEQASSEGEEDGSNGEIETDPVDWLTNDLIRLGLSSQDALTVAALAIEAGDKDPINEHLKRTVALLTPKGGLDPMKAKALKKAFAEYRKRASAVTTAAAP